MLKQKVGHFIKEKQLFAPNDKLLVALSGGADSVSLLRVLLELGFTCEAAHCNFHLRGEESDRDESFVTNLCKSFNIPLHIVHFQTEAVATERHISIEMAARELRYEWFDKLRTETGAQWVCVAHHQDDSVETILLNLIRGTGINGLCGIKAKNDYVVRPLLCVSREEITDYLQHLRQDYVTDSTNLQDAYTRNKIRLDLLPLMQQINPSVRESILSTSAHLSDVAQIYQEAMEAAQKRVLTPEGIDIEALRKENAKESLLFEILSPLGFNGAQVHDILAALDGQSGKLFTSNTHQVVKDRTMLLISALDPCKEPTLHYETIIRTPDFVISKERHVACLDADKIKEPLTLRLVQTGDAFIPFGMKGRKLVSDYLTDRKFSLLQKKNQWVLCAGEEIVWLVGERIDNRFRIDEHTGKVLCISVL